MIPKIREQFNNNFSEKKYQEFLNDLNSKHPGEIEFRVAETPVFIPKEFTKKMIVRALKKNHGNIPKAAAQLKITAFGLRKAMKRLGITDTSGS